MKQVIQTQDAPSAIGVYSQAIKVGATVYLSGQIGLVPDSMEMIEGGVAQQADQMFKNLTAVAKAAGADLSSVVKLTIYLTSMDDFKAVNTIMEQYCQAPYPARACVAVRALPKGALVEADAILVLDD